MKERSTMFVRLARLLGLFILMSFASFGLLMAPALAHEHTSAGHSSSAEASEPGKLGLTIVDQGPGTIELSVEEPSPEAARIKTGDLLRITVIDEETGVLFFRSEAAYPIQRSGDSPIFLKLALKPSEKFSVEAAVIEKGSSEVVSRNKLEFTNQLTKPTLEKQLPSMITLLLISVVGLLSGRAIFFRRKNVRPSKAAG